MYKEPILIESLDEVQPNIVYAHLQHKGKWFEIEKDRDGKFMISAHLGLYNFFCVGNRVRTWKTFSGALRFIKRQSVPGSTYHRYFAHWADKDEIEKQKKREQSAISKREESARKYHQYLKSQKVAIDKLKSELENFGFDMHYGIDNALILMYGEDRFRIECV